ncbi:zinc metallochaperone AztD [Gordonia zhaorongruii]|uniref:zinc metallochaperone AztD n=1 Tax=Gordonia zhaorongruii TaxID=2597659 RepID=UPI0010506132|nr:zinc metallochaperone AztD [Gordonia zhaorongruii]
MHKSIAVRMSALLITSAALLAACGSPSDDESGASAPVREKGRPTPRLVVSYDGGVRVLDGKTLETVADLPHEGFLRLNSAQDSRHVFVTADDGFDVLDTGTWRETHGDHSHYKVTEPSFTDIDLAGDEPGHVVPHDGRISLFFDGSGEAKTFDPADLAEGEVTTSDYRSPQAHHGVAVSRADGSLVVTHGDEDTRSGVRILDADRRVVASTDDCPGVHGEAAASGGALTFGCENGILVVKGEEITKIPSPDAYGRIGNQQGAPDSPIVLGDYKTRPAEDLGDDEIERPTRFSLTDTETESLRVVDLPAAYSFRSLARGQDGEAVILGTDGALYVFDPVTGRQMARHQVIGEWVEPVEWQDPMPSLTILGGTAYISDPGSKTMTAVDLATGEQTARTAIDVGVVETAAVTG